MMGREMGLERLCVFGSTEKRSAYTLTTSLLAFRERRVAPKSKPPAARGRALYLSRLVYRVLLVLALCIALQIEHI